MGPVRDRGPPLVRRWGVATAGGIGAMFLSAYVGLPSHTPQGLAGTWKHEHPYDTLPQVKGRGPPARWLASTSAYGAPTCGWLSLGAAVEDHAHLVGVGVRVRVGRRVRVEVGGWGWA